MELGKFLSSEKAAIHEAKSEVALAKRLLALLDTPGVSVFFETHVDRNWYDFNAVEAWEMWLHGVLTPSEITMYEENYEPQFSSISELRKHLLIESNRIPGECNADGY